MIAVFLDVALGIDVQSSKQKQTHNEAWWHEKIATNIRLDTQVSAALATEGWVGACVWEHDEAETAPGLIASLVKQRRSLSELAK
jgi:G:T-mismatch repair DNA endonuclease (very short patch repair protein)